MEKKIVITQQLFGPGLDRLKEKFDVVMRNDDLVMIDEELRKHIADADGAIFMMGNKVNEALLKDAKKLKVAANYAVGYDNLDIEYLTSRGIQATNTPGVLSDATADIAWALLMDTARRVSEGDRLVRSGNWKRYTPSFMLGKSITGKTLGIIGAGRIGRTMAKRSRGWDMKVLYHNRNRSAEFEKEEGAEYCDLKRLLTESDFVSLHVPLTDSTRGMIGRDEFKMMKESAILINTARGPVVDEEDLIEALERREICAAGLDVYDSEPNLNEDFLKLDNVVLLPHIGSADEETRMKMVEIAADNVISVLEGRGPVTGVNEV